MITVSLTAPGRRFRAVAKRYGDGMGLVTDEALIWRQQ
jgi:hypothetical protein